MSGKTILVWFRNDLRIHDNEILLEATRKADNVLPVYCFDPFYFKSTENGLKKTGNIRAKFLLESVADLRENLRKKGAELMVRTGDPVEIIPELALQYQVCEVYHHREVAFEETNISEQVEAALWKIKLNLKHFIGHTLYHKEDLPFPIRDIPNSFAVFKKKIERDSVVRPSVETPERINVPDIADAGTLPGLADLELTEPVEDPRSIYQFKGGETEGLKHLEAYIKAINQAGSQKNTRNPFVQPSRLSPWLSLGCLSQKQVYWAVVQHEQGTHHSNSPLIIELFWRDYFRFMFKKYGRQFFTSAGFKNETPELAPDQDALFELWKAGQTGVPFVDASMHELNATGYITNFSRQVVAGYLVNTLNVDWTKGAAYFEKKLIDYSPASNWGNWAFVAGVGSDPKENRYFSPSRQLADLETRSDFIDTWLPEPSIDTAVA
jgi:deoxyribodipyrimidine photo-lyase